MQVKKQSPHQQHTKQELNNNKPSYQYVTKSLNCIVCLTNQVQIQERQLIAKDQAAVGNQKQTNNKYQHNKTTLGKQGQAQLKSGNATQKRLCNCVVCHQCLKEWCLIKINQIDYEPYQSTVRCPREQCRKNYSTKDIARYFAGDAQIDEALMLKTCRAQPDVQFCPSKNCKYGGIVQNQKTRFFSSSCNSPYECAACGTQWNDASMNTSMNSAIDFIRAPLQKTRKTLQDFGTRVYKSLFTQQCPQCKVSIIKNGGCPNMTCRRCSTLFCWTCLQKKSSHKFLYCVSCATIQTMVQLIPVVIFLYYIGFYSFLRNQFSTGYDSENGYWELLYCPLRAIFAFLRAISYHTIIPLTYISVFEFQQTWRQYRWQFLLWIPQLIWYYFFLRWPEVIIFMVMDPQIMLFLFKMS